MRVRLDVTGRCCEIGIGEQEVDGRQSERPKVIEHAHRVMTWIDHGQHPIEDPLRCAMRKTSQNRLLDALARTLSREVVPMPVMHVGRPIAADAQARVVPRVKIQPVIVDQHAVALCNDGEVRRRQAPSQVREEALGMGFAEQQRLTPVNFQRHSRRRKRTAMFRQTRYQRIEVGRVQPLRPLAPALIDTVINVAIATVDIATLGDLDHHQQIAVSVSVAVRRRAG